MDKASETQTQASESQNQGSETQKKKKVLWRCELITKTFLEACIEEVIASGRLCSNLKPHSWIKVGEILKKTHNFEVDARHLRNRYDYQRSRYVGVDSNPKLRIIMIRQLIHSTSQKKNVINLKREIRSWTY
ncbi:hypothetical protein AgCh_027328 [Apium graveolens]